MTVKDIDSMSFDELKNEFIQFRKMMMDHISEQEKQIQDYKMNITDGQAHPIRRNKSS